MQGVDLTTVRELMGHKSLSMTLRYAHLSPQHTAAAVRVLDGKKYSSHDKNLTKAGQNDEKATLEVASVQAVKCA
jgi:hypothetical protein